MCYFSASKIVVISENSIKKTTSYSLLFSIGVDLILFFLTSFCELLNFFSGVESLQFYFFWIFETEFLCNPGCPGTCSKTRFFKPAFYRM